MRTMFEKFEKKELKRIQPQLLELRKQMIEISGMKNNVEAIIKLFQVIAPIQDAGGFTESINKLNGSKKYCPQLEALLLLQIFFKNIEDFRSEADLLVSRVLSRVQTAKKLTREEILSREFSSEDTLESWIVINRLGSFVKSHVYRILKQISVVLF